MTLTYTIANQGPGGATGVFVSAPLPNGLSFVSATPGTGTYDPSTGSWTVGTVDPGTRRTLTIQALVAGPGLKTVTASIAAADQFDPDAGDNSVSAFVTPQQADLSLAAAIDKTRPNVGETVAITLTLSNSGPDSATGAVVAALLPPGLSFAGATGPGAYVPATGNWAAGAVAGGASSTLTIRAIVASQTPLSLTPGIAEADQFDPDSGGNSAVLAIAPTQAGLGLGMTVDTPTPNVGDRVTFTLTLTNAGPDTATGVRVHNQIPAGLALATASPSAGLYARGSGVWEVGQLAPGASAVLVLVATVATPDPATVTSAVLAVDQFDPSPADRSSLNLLPQVAGVGVTHVVDNATPGLSEIVTLTATATNSGPDAATGVGLRYMLPAGLELITSTPGQGSYDPATGLWTVGSLAPVGSASLVLTARVTARGGLTASATLVALDQFDSSAADDSAAVVITPLGNRPPASAGDGFTLAEDTPLAIAAPGVLGNDSDPDGDPLSALLVAAPAHGVLTLNPDGSFTYVPAPNFSGQDSFVYRPSDGSLLGPAVTVILAIAPVDDVPTAAPDAYQVARGRPLSVPAGSVLLGNDIDPDGDAISAVLLAGPANGTLVLNPDGSFLFTPDPGFAGQDSFVYRPSDGTLLGEPVTVSVTVVASDSVPVANLDTYQVTPGQALDVPLGSGVLINDTDPDGDPLAAILVTGPANGSLTLNLDGSFTYLPNPGFSGEDSFVYRPSDGSRLGSPVAVTLTVLQVNTVPESRPDSYRATPGQPLAVPAGSGVLANDSANGTLTAVLGSGPRHGTLVLNPDGSFTYTPNPGYTGEDFFTYRASNGGVLGSETTISLLVQSPEMPARVAGIARYGFHAQPTQVVLAFDADLDPVLAQNLALYAIVHPGRYGKFGTRDDRMFPLKSAVYDEALRTVTLTPQTRLPLNGRYRVVVRGSQPLSATGEALDGDADGRPGGDYLGTLTRASLAGPARVLPRPPRWPVPRPRATTAAAADRGPALARPLIAQLAANSTRLVAPAASETTKPSLPPRKAVVRREAP